jgi:putative ABC transport system permease protein
MGRLAWSQVRFRLARTLALIPGVQVAAPIAMVGYAHLNTTMFVPVPAAALAGSGRELFRISTTWVSGNGASRVTQPPAYLYVTSLRIRGNNGAPATDGTGPGCMLGTGVAGPLPANPFGAAAQSYTWCWSRVNQYNAPDGITGGNAGYVITWSMPVLIAAIDPDAEATLDGLNKALVSGGYLKENESDSGPDVPVLASSDSGMDEYAQTSLQQLAAPSAMPDMNGGPWSVGPVDYQRGPAGALVPRQVVNPESVWYAASAAMDDEDSQYRTVTPHESQGAQNGTIPPQFIPLIKITGEFDPARIESFDPLSQVPLGDYQAITAVPATAASRAALHGSDLLPSENLGGLVSQPVNMITTLSALPELENTEAFTAVDAADPVSVIRVKVAGVTGPGALSQQRINAVALRIEQRTGLDVDIVAGSSPSPVTIDVPADKFGQPPLTLTENWVKEDVAVAILEAVDRQSVALFTLILVVCVLFIANAATAAVRGRRRELGVLAAVGWRRSRLFAAVLGELAGIGLGAGLLAAVTVAFRGQIIGTLLGGAVSVQVRGVDYIAAGATVALGVLAVAAGMIVTAAAALLPAALLRRLPAAHLLAEE